MRGSRPKGLSFGNEYGFYDEIPDSEENLSSAGFTIRDTGSVSTGTGHSERTSLLKLSLIQPDSQCTVICKMEESASPVACRSFTSSGKLHIDTTACISIDGLRIVQDDRGEDAEYHINLSLNGRTYLVWKRYSDFEELGDAFDEYSGHGLIVQKTKRLEQTIEAWHCVKAHRPWLIKNLSIQFLKEEFVLLDSFLRHLLFETPSLELLKVFVM